ncbi:hypothetical protein Q604_UNBC14435G0001, partial [human gut metagenome]
PQYQHWRSHTLSYKGDDGFRIVITPYNKIQKTTGKITEKNSRHYLTKHVTVSV